LDPPFALFGGIGEELFVANLFGIGVRLGADVAKDMIAVRMPPDVRMAVVGSPGYFAWHPGPTTPQDVNEHDCVGMNRSASIAVYRR
jgi:hypothetical protein